MEEILAHLRAGNIIPAIREYRTRYGVGLREAKDACEFARYVMGITTQPSYLQDGYIVAVRYDDGENTRYIFSTREEALQEANSCVANRDEVIVGRVISRSVIIRKMQSVD